MEEKVISVATKKFKAYFMCVPVAQETLGENGAVIETKGNIPDGEVVEFYTNLKCVKYYKNGLLDGPLKMVDIDSGKVTMTEEYREGDLKKFVDTGTIAPLSPKEMKKNINFAAASELSKQGLSFKTVKEGRVFYKNDGIIAKETLDPRGARVALEGAIPDGKITEYFESGKPRKEVIYRNNMLNGVSKSFDEEGRIVGTETYLDNILSGEAFYYDYIGTEQMSEKIIYENGLIEGKRLYFYPNGNLVFSENYANGKLNGKKEIYFRNGILNAEEDYKEGKLHGLRIFYHQNGAVWFKETYLSGMLEGERVAYYPSGEIYMKENYSKGLLQGEKTMLEKDGTVFFRENYSWGTPVSRKKK